MSSATVPDVPKLPNDVEDYVAALFQAAGFYVEKNIVEHGERGQILERDAVATDYSGCDPVPIVVEVKSRDAGFAEAFKVLGWMRYLGVERGALFVAREGRDESPLNEKLQPCGLSYCVLGDCSNAMERFAACGFPEITDPLAVDLWRFSYGVERRLLYDLRNLTKTADKMNGPDEVQRYLHQVRDEAFFEPDIRKRVSNLYTAFSAHPKLSLGCGRELDGGEFEPEGEDPDNPVIRSALYEGKYPLLQISFYVEHRARLALLKAAIDYACSLGGDGEDGVKLGWTAALRFPGSFLAGLEELSQHAYFRRYALFWQVFLWGFGGFYLADREDKEFSWLAEATGIPLQEIPRALRAFDILFPPGPWIVDNGASRLRIAKMVPFPMRAIGAYQRWFRYGLKSYADLGYSDLTARDLQCWHNFGVRFWNNPRKGFTTAID